MGQDYPTVHFERLIEIERELEELFAIQNDEVEIYGK